MGEFPRRKRQLPSEQHSFLGCHSHPVVVGAILVFEASDFRAPLTAVGAAHRVSIRFRCFEVDQMVYGHPVDSGCQVDGRALFVIGPRPARQGVWRDTVHASGSRGPGAGRRSGDPRRSCLLALRRRAKENENEDEIGHQTVKSDAAGAWRERSGRLRALGARRRLAKGNKNEDEIGHQTMKSESVGELPS